MAEVFDGVVARGYGRLQQRANEHQLRCRAFVNEHMQRLLFTRLRERFLRDVVICVGGFVGSDRDEALTLSCFSQLQFFAAYDELVFFVDKFDFLIRCVGHGVCNAAPGFEPHFLEVMLRVLTSGSVPAAEVTAMKPVLDRIPLQRRTRGETAESLRKQIAAAEAEQHQQLQLLDASADVDDRKSRAATTAVVSAAAAAAAASEAAVLTVVEQGAFEAQQQLDQAVQCARERLAAAAARQPRAALGLL